MDTPPASAEEIYQHRFFADVMLGTLARWLRILGYDTSYENFIDDDELIQFCGFLSVRNDVPRTGPDVVIDTAKWIELVDEALEQAQQPDTE